MKSRGLRERTFATDLGPPWGPERCCKSRPYHAIGVLVIGENFRSNGHGNGAGTFCLSWSTTGTDGRVEIEPLSEPSDPDRGGEAVAGQLREGDVGEGWESCKEGLWRARRSCSAPWFIRASTPRQQADCRRTAQPLIELLGRMAYWGANSAGNEPIGLVGRRGR